MIDVRIPYCPGYKLGEAYNKAMETVEDWVLFLDHDIFLLNPNWYSMLENAVRQVGHKAGWITCVTNRIACLGQRVRMKNDTDDLKRHRRVAMRLWKKHGAMLIEYPLRNKRGRPQFLSGFFMLTHKEAWKKVGGFSTGFIGVDNNYAIGLNEAGYKFYVMPGLYVYHGYTREWKWV